MDRLAELGTWSIKDEMKQLLYQRPDAADDNPDRLRTSEKVFADLGAKLRVS